jgi:hypothetical protein
MVLTTVRPAALALMLALSATVAQGAETPAPVAAPTAPADADSKPVPVSKATAEAAAKVTCRTVKMTGSNLRTRKVCSTADSQAGAGDWVRQQQDRGGLNASATLNNGN